MYFPELGSYEAFCLDEACAHALIALREDVRGEVEDGYPQEVRARTLRGASVEELEKLQHLWRRR